jgi:hypothetical protein
VMGLDPTRMQKWTSSGSGSKLWTDIAERRNGIYEKLRVRKRKFFFLISSFHFLHFIRSFYVLRLCPKSTETSEPFLQEVL